MKSKETKRKEAEGRQELYDALSPQEKLKLLPYRGASKKQIAKLKRQLAPKK